MVMELLISIQDATAYLILQFLLNLLEIVDLVVLLQHNGHHHQVMNIKMILMLFCFLLKTKNLMEKLFLIIKNLNLVLDILVILLYLIMDYKKKVYIHMNNIKIAVIIILEIIMPYLKMGRHVISMLLNMKFFKFQFLNCI